MARQRSPGWSMPAPRVAEELSPVAEGDLEDGARLDDVEWTSDGPAHGVRDLEVTASRISGVRLAGAELDRLSLLDVALDGCDLAGVTLTASRVERVELRGCRLSGLTAAELRARYVRFVECRLDDAWLRMARLERCELVDCDLTGADLYAARLSESRLLGCRLDGCNLSDARLDGVALHGSSLDGIQGAEALRGAVIATDQIVAVALPLLASFGIRVDDDYLDPPTSPSRPR